jgi:hypothetical protein
MKNKNNLLALVTLVLALPGALHAFSQEKDGIKISVKDFMNDPYAQVIDNPNWMITAEDLQKHNIAAIKVKVTNNTDKPICISGRSIRLTQAKTEDIAAKFKKRVIIRPILAYLGTRFVTGQVVEAIAPSPQPRGNTFGEMLDDLPRLVAALEQYSRANIGLLRARWMIPLVGSIAYGFYLSDLNNQLEILLKQSSLNEMITIAPKQSVEKVIFCEGMLSQNFNFSILNRSHVPVAEFAVDLCA